MWEMAKVFEKRLEYMGNDDRYVGNFENMCKMA